MATTKAQSLRTLFISLPDLVDVQAALDLLSNGKPLTAVQSGVQDYDAVSNLSLIEKPTVIFDGFNYTVTLFVTTG